MGRDHCRDIYRCMCTNHGHLYIVSRVTHFSLSNAKVSQNQSATSWVPWSSPWVLHGWLWDMACPDSSPRNTIGKDQRFALPWELSFKLDSAPWALPLWRQWCASSIPTVSEAFSSIPVSFVVPRITLPCWSSLGFCWWYSCSASWPCVDLLCGKSRGCRRATLRLVRGLMLSSESIAPLPNPIE